MEEHLNSPDFEMVFKTMSLLNNPMVFNEMTSTYRVSQENIVKENLINRRFWYMKLNLLFYDLHQLF